MSDRTTRDLAAVVYGKLSGDPAAPSLDVLSEIMHILFLVSLEHEEGKGITVSVSYLDPAKPDPDPPPLIRDDRWRFTPFGEWLPLTVGNLAKLAPAIDSEVASLAIFIKRNKPVVVGIIDQQHLVNAHRRYESDGAYPSPGVFQAEVVGLGHVMVLREDSVIGELKGGTLIQDATDVFGDGPVATRLRPAASAMARGLRKEAIELGGYWEPEDTDRVIESFAQTYCRILNRTKGFGHGGTLLISSAPPGDDLRIKYSLRYQKLRQSLRTEILSSTLRYYAQDSLEDLDEDDSEGWLDAHAEIVIHEFKSDDARRALEGAIGLISSLTRVDGAVLLTPDLELVGFGCEITVNKTPSTAYLVQTPLGKRRKKLDLEAFGTRHRSVVRYCNAFPGSVGFVVSQDGHVRAVTKVSSDTLMWNNIALTRHKVPAGGGAFYERRR